MGPEGKERSAKARSDCNGRNVRRTEGLKDGIPNRRNAWETERPASGTRVAGLRPAYVGAGKAQAESEGCPCGWKRWRRPPFCARRLRCSPQAACMWPVPPSPTILRVPRRAWRCAGRWRSPPPSSDAWRSHKDAGTLAAASFATLLCLASFAAGRPLARSWRLGEAAERERLARLRALVERYRENEDSIEQRCARAARAFDLTRREEELLGLLLEGKTRSEMARQLYVSNDTVKTHLRNLYRKTGVSGKAELAGNPFGDAKPFPPDARLGRGRPTRVGRRCELTAGRLGDVGGLTASWPVFATSNFAMHIVAREGDPGGGAPGEKRLHAGGSQRLHAGASCLTCGSSGAARTSARSTR